MRNVQSFALRDFTGGLNLRADQFQLGGNESPDILNMSVDPRGGLFLRPGCSTYGEPLAADGVSWHPFYGDDGEVQIIAQLVGGDLVWRDSGAWSDVEDSTNTALTSTVDRPMTSATFNDALYLQNGTDKPIKWDGTAEEGERLDQDWANDYAAPAGGDMPIARCITQHNGYIFVGNTLESGTRYRNRVRFSHLQRPEDFAEADYFDVGADHEGIVAFAPFADHLLVFKERSTWVVYGWGASDFQLNPLSMDVGAVAPQAVVSSPVGVYVFSERAGVMRYDGRSLSWVFDKLVPALDDQETILETRFDEIRAGWIDNKIWFSVPWGIADSRALVYDPSLGRDGSWTRYEYPEPLGQMGEFGVLGDTYSLALVGDQLVDVASVGQPWDDIADTTPQADTFVSKDAMDWNDYGGDVGTVASPYPPLWYSLSDVHGTYDPSQVVEVDAGRIRRLSHGNAAGDLAGNAFPIPKPYGAAHEVLGASEAVGTRRMRQTVGIVAPQVAEVASWIVSFQDADNDLDTPTLADATAVYVLLTGSGSAWTVSGYYYDGTTATNVDVFVASVEWYTAKNYLDSMTVELELDTTPEATVRFLHEGVEVGSATWTPTATDVHRVGLVSTAYTDGGFGPWSYDEWESPGDMPVTYHIDSTWVSPWVDAGEVAQRKRWRKPWMVLRGTSSERIQIEVFEDYDGSERTKQWTEQISRAGNGAAWDAFQWPVEPHVSSEDTPKWGKRGKSHTIERGSPLGLARSISLRFHGPTESDAEWGLDNITFTYVPKRLR